jgi:hypothetical protein
LPNDKYSKGERQKDDILLLRRVSRLIEISTNSAGKNEIIGLMKEIVSINNPKMGNVIYISGKKV